MRQPRSYPGSATSGLPSRQSEQPVCRRTPSPTEFPYVRLHLQLKAGDKVLVGNKGYRRYLKTPAEDHFVLDEARVAEDPQFDGIYVLRTNTRLTPLQAVLRYRELIKIERLFRDAKTLRETRPIFHQTDATIRGHVFCSFLALILAKALEDSLPYRQCRVGGHPGRYRPASGDQGRTGWKAVPPAHTDHRLRREGLPSRRRGAAAQHPRTDQRPNIPGNVVLRGRSPLITTWHHDVFSEAVLNFSQSVPTTSPFWRAFRPTLGRSSSRRARLYSSRLLRHQVSVTNATLRLRFWKSSLMEN